MLISDKMKHNAEVNGFCLEPDFHGKTLNIEITSTCNEDCIYCIYAAQGLHKERRMIDEEFFFRITKEAFDLGITDVGLYMTAEPLMNSKVYEYIAHLKKTGFRYVYISTNGILCTPKNLVKLVEAGVDSIKFSVSGATKESFYKHHGIDAFDLVKRNIEFAYQYRKENKLDYSLYMFSIITNYNLEEKELIKSTFEPFVDELVFADVLDGIIKLKGVEEYLMANKEAQYHAMAARTIPCPQLFNRIVIDESGYLCTCCYAGNSLTRVVNLHNITLSEALYSEKMKNIRKMHLEGKVDNTICNRCVTGSIEKMKPFGGEDNKYVDIEYIDREEEIKKRFI